MEKITRKNAIQFCIDNTPNMPDDVREVLEKIQVSFDKKKSNKPSVKQILNASMTDGIYAILVEANRFMTLKEIVEAGNFSEMSTQKLSALIKPLVDSGKIVKGGNRKAVAYGVANLKVEG